MGVYYLADNKIRISKLLTDQNICSRKKAEEFVFSLFIKANGKLVEKPEHKVSPTDFILLHKKAVLELQNQRTIILNKPPGFVSSFDDPKYELALNLATENNYTGFKFESIEPESYGVVGRLDADSRGLLIYSQDGSFAKSIIGEKAIVEKEYIVKIMGQIDSVKIKKLEFGLSLDGKALKRATIKQLGPNKLKFILVEGKNRQIRRMCGAVNLQVTDLHRVRIGSIHLPKDLHEGKWLFLSDLEPPNK